MKALKERRKKSLLRKHCTKTTASGEPCKKWALLGKETCNKHIKQAKNLPAPVNRFGIYAQQLTDSQKVIYDETARLNLLDEFRKPDLEDELILARIIVADMLNEPDMSNPRRLKALEVLSKITRTAKLIKEYDVAAVKADFMVAIQDAITYAFQRANSYSDPAVRSRVFVDEFASFFPSQQALIEGELASEV